MSEECYLNRNNDNHTWKFCLNELSKLLLVVFLLFKNFIFEKCSKVKISANAIEKLKKLPGFICYLV